MKKYLILCSVFLLLGIAIGTGFFAYSEESLIPSWIKNTAKFWVEGNVSDREFLNAIQFLIDHRILSVSPQEPNLDLTNKASPLEDVQIRNQIRDCIKQSELYNEYTNKVLKLEYGAKMKEQLYIGELSESIGICDSRVKDAENNCEYYNLCSGTLFDNYWKVREQAPKNILYPYSIITLGKVECNSISDIESELSVSVKNNFEKTLSPTIKFTTSKALYNGNLNIDFKSVVVSNLEPNQERIVKETLLGSGNELICSVELLSFK